MSLIGYNLLLTQCKHELIIIMNIYIVLSHVRMRGQSAYVNIIIPCSFAIRHIILTLSGSIAAG